MNEDNITAVKGLLRKKFSNINELTRAKREVARDFALPILTNAQILRVINENNIKVSDSKLNLLKKRAVRTMSGIAPVAVLTRAYPCPGKCAYCPTEKNVPQSYLSNEPAVMRAIRCDYNPFVQVQDRLRALVNNGHDPSKIELIVIGGSWSALPKKYKYWYILNLFAAANRFTHHASRITHHNQILSLRSRMTDLKEELRREQKRNEKAKYRIIGLTLETRPDMIDIGEIKEMRELGCTRVELGVQAVDDEILKLNRRGHGVKAIAEATALLRRHGFKITYHFMPGLPGSTPSKDFKMYKRLFSDPRFQPDQIKFYPTVVTEGSLLYRWWQQGKYKPYSGKKLEELIAKCKAVTPEYVRIIRLIRDIPGESIVAGNMVTNLRQVMQDRGVKCRCIRCRQARKSRITQHAAHIKTTAYSVVGGVEHFFAFESKDGQILYGFCRLFLPDHNLSSPPLGEMPPKKHFVLTGQADRAEGVLFPVLKNAALIRELHVYGELVSPGGKKKVQHSGLGRKLLQKAEELAKNHNYDKVAVISGIGVRDYYRKNGYRLANTYLYKK